MNLPSDLDSAVAMLATLVGDDRLVYGLATVAVVLVIASVITWAIVTVRR